MILNRFRHFRPVYTGIQSSQGYASEICFASQTREHITRSFQICSRLQSWITGLVVLLCFGLATPALAETPIPRLKPTVPNISSFLSDRDAKHFRYGLRAAKRAQWDSVELTRKRLKDPTAKDVMIWIQAVKDPFIDFNDLTYVTQTLSDWPRMTGIRAKAEGRLFDKPLSAQRTIDWFVGQDPVSGEGRAALARAYYQLGNRDLGDRWLKYAWRESKLTRDRQRSLYRRYKNRLTPDDHAARADYLVWLGRRHFGKVNGLLSLMPKSDRGLIDARMRLAGNRSGIDRAVDSVPARLENDTGFLFERARWRRRKKSKSYALPLYLQINKPPTTDQGKKRLWTEKKIMAYWAISENRFKEAYALSRGHGFERGSQFAESEFLSGWLALTKLSQPEVAAKHFETLRSGVSFPVSLSRASYWQGRAAEALNKGLINGAATGYYMEAAQFPNTYYGQLAAQRLDGPNAVLSLPPESDGRLIAQYFERDTRVRAMHLLAEFGDERNYSHFAFLLDDEFDDPRQLTLLSQMARSYGFMRPSLRAAKQASRFQSMLTDSGYPRVEAIEALPTSKFDIPLVYAIARQESEFDFKAVSSAKAYGMMQMINATAKLTARKHRIPYNRSRLTTDVHYNANLGALHLNDLLEDYDGSYIMAAAAYNAGPNRVKQWVKSFGDPRTRQIDPIDWVESIPFTETRNYVQRVMENMQVYKARLNGNRGQNTIYADLSQGAF